MDNKDNFIELTKQEAKIFMLKHHFLLPPRKLEQSQGIMNLVSRLGCIQFDTINVIGRNADLVLQSRIKNYRAQMLEELLYHERVLMDGWDKVASIYKSTDWPYFKRHRDYLHSYYEERAAEPRKIIPEVSHYIKKNGPTSSLDFKDNRKTDWAWGPTSIPRAALELLYAEGTLGIHHRVNTRRYFDLIENLLPGHILNQPDPNPNDIDYLEWHILRRIGGIGIAALRSGEHWLGIRGGRKVDQRKKIIPRLIEKRLLLPIKIEGSDITYFIRSEDYTRHKASKESSQSSELSFIAPLDNLLWDRKLIKEIFDFQYIWEVYKPKKIRKYGYYVLPVLYGTNFVARVEFEHNKKSRHLELKNWWWEDKIFPDQKLLSALANALEDFINYLEADKFMINQALGSLQPLQGYFGK